MKTINTIKSITLVAALAATSFSFAQEEDMRKAELKGEKMVEKVTEGEMLPTKNIVENASVSADHTTLVTAVAAAGLVETLEGEGPFTVFAPTNAAFDKLPEGTVETLLKAENKGQLSTILTYHVLAGKFEAKDVITAITEGNGKAELTTVSGGILIAMLDGDSVKIKDASGNVATVVKANILNSNGVIHVTDTVSLPAAEEEEMEDNK